MPIWLRKFTFQKLKEHYDKANKENESWENAQKSQLAKIQRPAIDPSYSVKLPSK